MTYQFVQPVTGQYDTIEDWIVIHETTSWTEFREYLSDSCWEDEEVHVIDDDGCVVDSFVPEVFLREYPQID